MMMISYVIKLFIRIHRRIGIFFFQEIKLKVRPRSSFPIKIFTSRFDLETRQLTKSDAVPSHFYAAFIHSSAFILFSWIYLIF